MRFGGYRALNGLESPVSRTVGISLDLRSELESVVSCNANRATRMDHAIVRDPNIPEVPRFSSGLAFPFRPGSTIEDGGHRLDDSPTDFPNVGGADRIPGFAVFIVLDRGFTEPQKLRGRRTSVLLIRASRRAGRLTAAGRGLPCRHIENQTRKVVQGQNRKTVSLLNLNHAAAFAGFNFSDARRDPLRKLED
jgi:hypothetical protein